jgi:hypothetical protein
MEDSMDTDLSTGATVESATVETTSTKPERQKRGHWVAFLNGLSITGTDLTFPSREELMRVRASIVTGANRLGIEIKTKSGRGSTTLNVRLKTNAEVVASFTKVEDVA